MTEQLFANVSEHGITVTSLTGAKNPSGVLYLKGTQDTSPRELKYNGVNQLNYKGTDYSNSRGINLTIFESDMTIVSMATFDLCSGSMACDSLSTRINMISDTQIGVMTSSGAISSNANLDATFKAYRSVSWVGVKFFSNEYNKNSSYAAIVCGKKKAIVVEEFVGNNVPQPNAFIEATISDPTKLGYQGFGKALINDDELRYNVDSNETVYAWLDKTQLTELNAKANDQLLFKSLGEIDAVAASGNVSLVFAIEFYNSVGNKISEETSVVNSVEGWEDVEIRSTIPTNCVSLTTRVKQIRVGSTPIGKCYVKNTVMQLCDNTEEQATTVSIGLNHTIAKTVEDSLGNFGQYDPIGYHQAHSSDSNLLFNKSITNNAVEPVRWFDYILENPSERSVISTNSSFSAITEEVTIDPKKFYYVCVWVNKQQKDGGEYRLRFTALDNSGASLVLRKTNDLSVSDKEMYSQMPSFDSLEQRQWYLLQGFLLPHHIKVEHATAIVEANKEFYGWDDLYGTGIGLSDEGTGEYGWVNNASCVKGYLSFVDNSNAAQSKSFWALPMIRELRTASIDIDDGRLTSINLNI